jgi:hypothetical protein
MSCWLSLRTGESPKIHQGTAQGASYQIYARRVLEFLKSRQANFFMTTGFSEHPVVRSDGLTAHLE